MTKNVRIEYIEMTNGVAAIIMAITLFSVSDVQ